MIRDKHCWIFLGALFLSMVYTPFAQTALLVSERQVQQRFEQRWEQMIKTVPLSRNASKRAQVQCVTKQIIKKLDEPYRSYYDWEVKLFVDPKVNAEAFYMMEAGRIAVTEGVFKVAANQDELAVIIGHEIIHIVNKHPYEMEKRIQRADIGINLATMAAAGKIADQTMRSQSDVILAQTKISGIGAIAQGVSQFGLKVPYKKNLEKEADIDGLLLMARAGFNPLAAISMWKKMIKQDNRKVPEHEYSSTHPSDEDRINDLLLNQREALKQYNAVESKPNCGYRR
jgi:predicted Zn-dependent protease